jgi:phage baseplate assembly protein W
MPTQVQKINTIDLQPRKALGVRLPFSAPAVFYSTLETKEAIRVNLLNFFLTGQGERYFNLNFGTGVRNLLFENINNGTSNFILQEIRERMNIYFPKVIINSLQSIPDESNNLITFYLKYSIRDTNILDEELTIGIQQ